MRSKELGIYSPSKSDTDSFSIFPRHRIIRIIPSRTISRTMRSGWRDKTFYVHLLFSVACKSRGGISIATSGSVVLSRARRHETLGRIVARKSFHTRFAIPLWNCCELPGRQFERRARSSTHASLHRFLVYLLFHRASPFARFHFASCRLRRRVPKRRRREHAAANDGSIIR